MTDIPLHRPAPRVARGPLQWTLRSKLVGLVLLGFVASVGIGLLSLLQMHKSSTAAAESMAAHMAATLAMQIQYVDDATSGRTVVTDARTTTQRFVDFVHQAQRRDLELVDTTLKIVADADHADIGKTLDGNEAAAVSATVADGRPRTFVEATADGAPPRHQAVVALPGAAGGAARGALVFEYTELLDEVGAAERAGARDLLLVAVPLGALLVGAALWGGRRITRAIGRLHAATLGLASGRDIAHIGHHGSDELGDLARAFDQMVDHLMASQGALRDEVAERRRAQDEVQRANDELEQRVLERTTLLTQSNKRLDAELVERQRIERQLEQMARFDPLTGLPNRSLFLNQLELALERAKRNGKLVGLMFVDLDRFKSINDSLGHEIGDGVLQEVAQRMRTLLRQTDIVSRIGGDEFTVIVEDVDDADTFATIAAKLVAGFEKPLNVAGNELFVTLSVGIAISPTDSGQIGELMKQADFAMYHAKAEGRNGYQFHSERMGEAARGRLAIEHALRHAIEREEFSLHYQVRVSAKTNRPVGMEALLRWNSPELGSVPPVDFIPVAEDTGIILALGEWVLRTACAQHTAWRLDGLHPGVIGVNVSARQFRQVDFVAQVVRIAAETGIAPRDVELEVTESMLMRDPEHASALMTELRALGFGIAIDDFGTGYSSLSHLKRFPATKIKIDRSFVSDIDTNPDDAAIAAAIVALAGTLSIQVTAEGVETRGQLARLGRLECTEYQGYLFSQPLPVQSMREVLRRGLRPIVGGD